MKKHAQFPFEERLIFAVASMAHELRTPLAALKSAAQGIQQVLPSLIAGYQPNTARPLSRQTLDLLSRVVSSLDQKVDEANQVMDMLLTSIRECHDGTFKAVRCSAKNCIRKALSSYVFPASGKPNIIWDENSTDFVFYGKEILIIHVLYNLLKNAICFIRKAGKGEIHIWLEHHDQYNTLHVKDTGMGIRKAHLKHIFEPFFTRDVRKGTGIGLAFCAFTLQALGGNIRCESVYEEHTEFILTFPLNPY